MGSWSPADTIAMELRHLIEGEKRIARQEALVLEQIEKGHNQIVVQANELLVLLRESLELSKERLQDLKRHYGNATDA
jgi:hypothetical protein